MSPILFFIIFFICTGVGKIFLQINSAAVAFIDILIAAWEGLKRHNSRKGHNSEKEKKKNMVVYFFMKNPYMKFQNLSMHGS